LFNILKIEIYKYFYRRTLLIFWLALVAILIISTLFYVGIEDNNKTGFQIAAFAFEWSIQISALFFLIISCLSFSEELTYGTIKNIVTKYPKRKNILFGKVLSLVIIITLTIFIALLFSLFIGMLLNELSDLKEGEYLIYSFDYQIIYFIILSIASIFPFLPLILLGILISLIIRDIGKSMIVAIIIFFLVNSLIQFTNLSKYFFLSYIKYFPSKISALTGGLEITFVNEIYIAIFVISFYSILFGLLADIIFSKKDIW
jgi:ABC-type transport system involved in multi-copper enzyme maturation permease subunit